MHDSGTDVRVDYIQGYSAPRETSCENSVKPCITLNIMKALELDMDLSAQVSTNTAFELN